MRCLLGLLLAVALPAHAARPFNTDDARIVDKGGCQLETFVKKQRRFDEHEFWFLPACNPFGVELTLGALRVDSQVLGDTGSVVMQGKMLLKPLETNGAGFALTLGTFRVAPAQARATSTARISMRSAASRSPTTKRSYTPTSAPSRTKSPTGDA